MTANRVALVTGSGRGLGRAYALALASSGFSVVVNSPSRPEGASALAVAEEIRSFGGGVHVHVGDVSSAAGGRAAVEATVAAFGRIDVLVSNAGVVLNKPFADTTEGDLRQMVAVHLAGPFATAQAAYGEMQERGWGRIVLTGTGSAAFGLENQAAYASAKAAMIGLCRVLALEGDPRVLMNVVLPVAPPLGRTPASARIQELFGSRSNRLAPEWVAPLVCLLAGDACPGTGGVYSAVAGRYARVFTAVARGWQATGERPPHPDELAANIDAILDTASCSVPGSILDEIAEVAARHPCGRRETP